MKTRESENYEINQLQARARSVARKYKRPNEADDFAQEAVIAMLAGRKASLEQLFIDYLRAQYGRTGVRSTSGGRAKSAAIHGAVSLDQPISGENQNTLYSVIAAPGRDPRPFGADWRDRVSFRGRNSLIAELRYDFEMSPQEIADLLGVSAARISQLFRGIEKEIQRCAILSEVADTYKDDEEYSKLQIRWIKL